jgi:hypothetical protein
MLLVENPSHNHDPIPPIAFHQHRKLTEAGHQLIDHLTQAKSQLREMLTSLRLANPDQLVIAQDIYNDRKRLRQDNLAGRTPIEAMHQFLQDGDWFIRYNTRISSELTHLFFAHPKSIELFKPYPEVLMMDCTYKVTRFRMPLLVIVGTTAVNETFFVGFAFLCGETEEDYLWAIRQLKTVTFSENITWPEVFVTDREMALINAIEREFPRAKTVLCEWHVANAVLVKVQRETSYLQAILMKRRTRG